MQGMMNTLAGVTRHTFHFENHIDEDVLECYALGRIQDEERLAPIEEHLLVCESCRDRLGEMDQYLAVMKSAMLASVEPSIIAP
jgi:predicted anti-sigma-YlaC factor YlaD